MNLFLLLITLASFVCAYTERIEPEVIKGNNVIVHENDGEAVVQITRYGSNRSSILIQVATVNETAKAGVDYTAVFQAFKFPSFLSTISVRIPIRDDDIALEPNITFTVAIISYGYVKVLCNATVTIVDNDNGVCVKFSHSLYSTMESRKRLQGAVLSSRPLQTSYQIRLKYFSGNATSGLDFADTTRNVKFKRGKTVAIFTVPITKDKIFEGTEIFAIQLANHKSASKLNVEICDPSTAIGQINDETPTVSFNQSAYSVDENKGALWPALVLSDFFLTNAFILVLTTDGSAYGGFDYISGPYIVKISTGKNTASFRIAITNDNKRENDETFYLAVDSSSLPNGVVVGSPGQAKVTIVDKTSTAPPTKLPCDSVLRRIRPQLFTHCLCAYTTWTSWTRTGTPVMNNNCSSNYSFYETRSRKVLSNGSCTDTQGRRSVCEPTLEQKATILIRALDLGLPASSPKPTNGSSSRRSVPNASYPSSKETFTSQQGLHADMTEHKMEVQSGSTIIQETTIQSDCIYDGDRPMSENGCDSSKPLPFDLEKHLSEINFHRQRRDCHSNLKRYVLFVLDTSGSIGEENFEKMLNVLSEFIPLFCGDTSFAIMTFGDIMKKDICFNCKIHLVTSEIKEIMYRNGPYTRTGQAAKFACGEMLNSNCGYNISSSDPIITDVLFFTDGQSNGDLDVCVETNCFDTINNQYDNLDLYVFAFGIGNFRAEELDCIVGNRGNAASKFNLQTFNQFYQLKETTITELMEGAITCFEP